MSKSAKLSRPVCRLLTTVLPLDTSDSEEAPEPGAGLKPVMVSAELTSAGGVTGVKEGKDVVEPRPLPPGVLTLVKEADREIRGRSVVEEVLDDIGRVFKTL